LLPIKLVGALFGLKICLSPANGGYIYYAAISADGTAVAGYNNVQNLEGDELSLDIGEWH